MLIKVAIFEDNRSLRDGLAAMIGGTTGLNVSVPFLIVITS